MKLIICNTAIHQDAEGRFSLNDLHRSAVAQGVTKDIRPNEWLALDRTKEISNILITENSGSCPIDAKVGRYGGTYVAKELVYEYAMWISPSFHLQVIRTFDALVMGNVTEAQRRVRSSSGNTALDKLRTANALKSLRWPRITFAIACAFTSITMRSSKRCLAFGARQGSCRLSHAANG